MPKLFGIQSDAGLMNKQASDKDPVESRTFEKQEVLIRFKCLGLKRHQTHGEIGNLAW